MSAFVQGRHPTAGSMLATRRRPPTGFDPQVGCSGETELVLLSASFSECDPERSFALPPRSHQTVLACCACDWRRGWSALSSPQRRRSTRDGSLVKGGCRKKGGH